MTFLNKWLNEWKLFFLTYTVHLGAVYKQRIYVNTLILMIFREKIRVTFIQLEKSKLDEAHNWFMITLLLTLNILSLNFYFFLKAPLSLPTFSGDFKIPLAVVIVTSILEHFNAYMIYPSTQFLCFDWLKFSDLYILP